jgi:hypothetical protein
MLAWRSKDQDDNSCEDSNKVVDSSKREDSSIERHCPHLVYNLIELRDIVVK